MLEEVNGRLKNDFDLSGNRLGGEVKAGGSQRNGGNFIDWYLSYKNSANLKVSLGLMQADRAAELEARVGFHDMAGTAGPVVTTFKMDRFEDAEQLYRKHLQQALYR